MSIAELAKAVGKEGLISAGVGTLTMRVVVHDVKQSYGKVRYLVRPAGSRGTGEAWVENISLDP